MLITGEVIITAERPIIVRIIIMVTGVMPVRTMAATGVMVMAIGVEMVAVAAMTITAAATVMVVVIADTVTAAATTGITN
jgi:hypothetical protein